ncbi:hypothetical protein B7C51_21020 [Paenibacillus larvae subsp. pulvifaciens]|uniref:ADP ribosyltransferase domain-containing protein n=2 Tax=Paenibacillus larvae TaxID=1464 RepID=A0A1V0UXB6_9BACL|nr:hypothetical protein B7C51_21020 [Paenibacillus larvae subsp. pulvifaciens]
MVCPPYFVCQRLARFLLMSFIFRKQNRINLGRCKMLRLGDFRKDREKAKKWAKEKSEKWKKSLGSEEKRLLEDSVSFQRVNDTLEKNRGRSIKISSIRKNVDRLDKALEVREAKLDDSIYVYRNLVQKELGTYQIHSMKKGK